ncbi:MAG: RIP metalloprotease [Holosporales bacterium]|nr:RIP metalloprotease [Holosporales bacterium]
MAFLEKIWDLGASILPFLVVLLIIVFVHEMGHFLIARHYGVQVTTFSVGYGSELCGWTDKKGTRWRISSLPIGGYVMMLGDADATSVRADLDKVKDDDRSKTVHSKTPWQRIMISFGGPLFNLLFTIIVIASIGIWKGIPDVVPVIQSVSDNSVASKCGLQANDLITGLGDKTVTKLSEMSQYLKLYNGMDTEIHYRREGKDCVAPISLYELDSAGNKTPVSVLGVALSGEMIYEHVSPGKALLSALQYCYFSAKSTTRGLTKMITRENNGAQLGGIFSIGEGVNKSLSMGIVPFFTFMAMLSFSLAFFNLLPIPVLDGGSIFLNTIELIIRRPISAMFTNVVYFIGMGVVGLMMIVALWNDVVRMGFVGKVVSFVQTLFGGK